MVDNQNFKICSFEALSPAELYAIMKARQEVFVVEQNCCYLDADGKDALGLHLFLMQEGAVIAYARLLPPSVSYTRESSIGRVLTAASHRGMGLGKILMRMAMKYCLVHWADQPIYISAQGYLENFYKNLGFVSTENRYLEDGIPHLEMHFYPPMKK
jgi:ElaA protein